MTTFKRIMVAVTIGAGAAILTNATDYTFLPPEGDWSVPGNRAPFGTPNFGDTATIPTGKLCKIELTDAAVTGLLVDGTLRLNAKGLYLRYWDQNVGFGVTIGAGATIQAWKGCYLSIDPVSSVNECNISGNGVIVATGYTEGVKNALIIGSPPEGAVPLVHIGVVPNSRPTIEGHVTVHVHIDNHGLWKVNAPEDTMVFGRDARQVIEIQIGGSTQGAFSVSAGRMEFRWTNPKLNGQPFQCPWIVGPAGTLELTPHAKNSNWRQCQHGVAVNSGALYFNMALPLPPPQGEDGTTFGTTGDLQFTGSAAQRGRITLRAGQSARFKIAAP